MFLNRRLFVSCPASNFIILCGLGAGALLNARLLYLLDAFGRRKWYDA
jgi:hypothetical protein